MLTVKKIDPESGEAVRLADYAEACSLVAGKHLADLLRENGLRFWEAVFAAYEDGDVVGFCALLQPEQDRESEASPQISSIFVEKEHRDRGVGRELIDSAADYAKEQGFSAVYLPSGEAPPPEDSGFEPADESGAADYFYRRTL